MNQQTAQGLASLGRGPDSMLVHMAPQEVAGLQALAMKHGGSLTINPETGLPEAGFLSSILPMVLGAGLAATGIGAPMAAMLVGGGYGVAKGSLKEGLMAGLGAYGGAGLGAGLMGAAPAAAATPAAVTSPAAMPVPNFTPVASAPLATSVAAGTPLGFNPAFDPTVAKFITPDTLFPSTLTPPPPINIGATPPSFERMGAGLKDVFSSGDKALAFAKENAYPLGAVGLSALAGMQPKSLKASPQDQGMIRPYTYSREKIPSAFQDVAGEPLSSKERRYFTDQYTALAPYKAPGPEYMAVGGPVEAMSNGNNLAAYMGQDKFAEGGSIGGYAFDPRTGLYTKPSGEGATTVSPTGGVSRASGEGDGDPFSYINPNVAKETFEEQSARNQELNNLLTNLSTVLSPGATILSGLLSTPFAGAIANAFGGTQDASKHQFPK
jgi:hypothetical protein